MKKHYLVLYIIFSLFFTTQSYSIDNSSNLEKQIKHEIFIGNYNKASVLAKKLPANKKITDICYPHVDIKDWFSKLDVKNFSSTDTKAIYKILSDHLYEVNSKNNIPYITHYIWSTNPYNPKEIKPRDIKRIKQTLSLLKQDNNKYVHYLWVNQKGLIPKSLEALKEFNIIVKEVKELSRFKELQNEIIFLDKFNVGAYSDFVRLLILEEYGGIYMDVDVWLKNKPNFTDMHKYASSLFTYGMNGDTGIANGFMIAKVHHPFIKEIIQTSIKNINFSTSPDSIKYLCNKGDRVFFTAGSPVIDAIFYKYYYNRTLANLDLFVPFSALFDDTDFKQPLSSYYVNIASHKIKFTKIGTYGASHSWNSNEDLSVTNWQKITNFINLNIARVQKVIYLIKKNELLNHIYYKI